MLGVAAGIPWAMPDSSVAFAVALGAFNMAVIAAGWRAWMRSLRWRVLWDASGHWWLIDARDRRHPAELRADSVAHSRYLWLKWNCDGRRRQRFVLRADCTPTEWRRWQARLHWQARRPAREAVQA